MTLTEDDFDLFNAILDKATRLELDELLEKLNKEIYLSDCCIREGTEKRE